MKKIILIILFLGLSLMANTMQFVKTETIVDTTELTIDNIISYMKGIDLKHINILLAQIHQETGNLKHIKYENNLFGFRSNKYLTFDTWQECIDYMKIWQDKYWEKYLDNGGKDYYAFLVKKKYAEDIEYILKLKKIVKIYNYVGKYNTCMFD